jgi:transposase-like protein
MQQDHALGKFDGIVEIDEAYIGGKPRHSIPQTVKPGKRQQDHYSPTHKAAVVSVLQRGGRIHSRHVERVTSENLKPILTQLVAEDAHIMTDTSTVLASASIGRKHSQVNHTEKEYVRHEDGICVTTNAVEGFFANLKRGINGVYHHVGKQHLHRYLSEFDFRYNAKEVSDGERTLLALKGFNGKRLTYR